MQGANNKGALDEMTEGRRAREPEDNKEEDIDAQANFCWDEDDADCRGDDDEEREKEEQRRGRKRRRR